MNLTNENIRPITFLSSSFSFLQKSALGHGGCIWDGALVLIKYFEKNFTSLSKKYSFQDKHILELGSGTGICGICFSCFSPKMVCLTDLKELHSLMRENIKINEFSIKSCEIIVEELIWGKGYQEQLENIWSKTTKGFDFLIGSDLIDSSGKFLTDLLETLLFCFEKNEDLVMFHCYTMHKKSTVDRFLEMLKENQLIIEEIEAKDMDEEFNSEDINIIIIKKKKH